MISARIRFLSITVPADIYSSGIICDISGIAVHLKLLPEESHRAGKDHHPSGHDGDEVLPTPAHLAESFLETEPKEEKEELQAAISSQSQVLQRTTASLSDDEEEVGLGVEGLSLPSFVAGFLKGVVDRLQVSVRDISVRVDMGLRQEGMSRRPPGDKPDVVSWLLNVGEVVVGAVSNVSDDDSSDKEGQRLISIFDADMALVSDPTVFSNYSRFASPTSPSATIRSRDSRAPSTMPSPQVSFNSSRSAMPSIPPGISSPEQRMEESTHTNDGRFSDADTEEENRSYRPLEDSQRLSDDGLLDNPGYLDSVLDLQIDDDAEDSRIFHPEGKPYFEDADTPRSYSPELHASGSQLRDRETTGFGGLSNIRLDSGSLSEDNERGDIQRAETSRPETPRPPASPDSNQDAFDMSPDTDSESSPAHSSTAELSESRIFSNEEAHSMYMSATSHASPSKSFMRNIPGAFEESPKSAWNVSYEDTRDHSSSQRAASRRSEEQDETTVSTPKLSARSERLDDSQDRSQHEGTGRRSDASSPAPDKVTGVEKKFVNVSQISIWLPAADAKTTDTQESLGSHHGFRESSAGLGYSTTEEDMLRSTTYASARLHRDSTEPSASTGTHPRQPHHPREHDQSFSDAGDKIAIEVSSVEVQFDIATAWLLTKMGQKVVHVLSPGGNQRKERQGEQSRSQQAFSLALDKYSVKFVEHLPGYAHPDDLLQSSPSFRSSVEDVILQSTVSGVKANYSARDGVMELGLDVSKIAVGFASEDLLTFNEQLKMRESTRDTLAPAHGDISLYLHKSSESARLNLTTLPVQLNLNIQRIEEMLGCLGGLSTILELGNSISSASPRGSKKNFPQRPRGVHFATAPPPVSSTQSESVPWKLTARIGGIGLDIVGENHFVKLRTTAAKVASRFEGIFVQIDRAKLTGPFLLDDDLDTPAKVPLGNIRVEYLFTPKEVDLDRLLALITPSQDKYDEDDDIMLDTLVRQRRQGSVLRVTISEAKTIVFRTEELESLSQLGKELGRLSTVTKYLPEDGRPGMLTLGLIKNFEGIVHIGGRIGDLHMHLMDAEAAYTTIPCLVAAKIATINIARNQEDLVGEALPPNEESPAQPLPMIMGRFIPDEIEPTIKVKLHNLRAEYTVHSIMDFLGLNDDMSKGHVASNMAKSFANLAEAPSPGARSSGLYASERSYEPPKPLRVCVVLRDCTLGLNPRGTPARGLLVFASSKFTGAIHERKSSEATVDLRKASVMVIDDLQNVGIAADVLRARSAAHQTDQIQSLIDLGYVPVSSISSATATAKLMQLSDDETKSVDLELKDNLLILETCADSTQTIIAIANGLQLPTRPSTNLKYRTEVMPIQDMFASFTGDAFPATGDSESPVDLGAGDERLDDELEYVSDFYPAKTGADNGSEYASGSGDLLDSFHSQYHVSSSVSELDFREDHFAQQSDVGGTAHRWDSAHNTYGLSNDEKLKRSPLRVRVRNVHVIWNLFDGYDWQRTRDTISKAVKDVEARATERRAKASGRASPSVEEEEDAVIGDCLFNSIYIGIPAHKDPRELRGDINRNIDDLASETGSCATTSTVTATRPTKSPSAPGKRLRLSRSKYHKMTFELKGVCADLVVFPADSEETQSSLDVRVDDLEIFDHVPTSTWKKFASYMREAGEKEIGTSMAHLEILTVKPVPELAASEIVLKVRT